MIACVPMPLLSITFEAHQRHYLLGVKDGDHAVWCHQVQVAEQAGRVTDDERQDRVAGVAQSVSVCP